MKTTKTQKNIETKSLKDDKAQSFPTRLSGTVVSDKMQDTVVVVIERYVKIPKYQKFVTLRTRLKAHNPGNTKKIGDKVTIQSCRPISRHKSFVVIE